LGFWTLAVYGIGDILGAGIYALVGKVAGISGQSAWLSFVVSAVLAAVTGLSYAELTSRIPKAAGAAAFCGRAFRHPLIPYLVGLCVLASGVTSTAAVSLAFYGYLKVFLDVPQLAAAISLICLMSLLSFWGIRESAGANNILTAIEVSGLLLVIGVGFSYAAKQNPGELLDRIAPSAGFLPVLSGATLAFYAFIGFEDLANLAEEAKNPSRDLPRAILTAVGVTTLIYLCVIFVLLWAIPPQEAASSMTPLLDVLKKAGFSLPPWGFAPIALFAVCNTGLANLVMASRLLYGMADQGLLPRPLALIHPGRRTPWVAVLTAMALCVALVLTGTVGVMAQTTSLLLTAAFLVMHLSLILIRRREPAAEGTFRAPGFVPYLGIGVCLLLSSQAPAQAYLRMALVIGVGILLYPAFPGKAGARVPEH